MLLNGREERYIQINRPFTLFIRLNQTLKSHRSRRIRKSNKGKNIVKNKKPFGCSLYEKGRDKLKDKEQKEWWNTKRTHRGIGETEGAVSLVIWHNTAKQQQK